MWASAVRDETVRFLFALENTSGAPITGATLPVRVVHAGALTVALSTGNATEADSTNLPGVYYYDYTIAADEAYGNILAHANASAISGASVQRLNAGYNVSQRLAYLDAALSTLATSTAVGQLALDHIELLTDTGTIKARLGNITGSGVNTVLGFFQALARSNATLPSNLGGTFDPTTDSLQAVRDRGDAAWTTGSGGATVEEIRTEMDSNSTQLAAIKAKTDLITSSDRIYVYSSVSVSEDIEIVRGSSYMNADSRALSFDLQGNVPSLTGGSCAIRAWYKTPEGRGSGEIFLNKAGTVASSTSVRFDITSAESALFTPGRWQYELEVTTSGGNTIIIIPPSDGVMIVKESVR